MVPKLFILIVRCNQWIFLQARSLVSHYITDKIFGKSQHLDQAMELVSSC